MSDIKEVKVPLAGILKIEVKSTGYPQSIAGKIFKYDADQKADGEAGIFTSTSPMVVVGSVKNFESYTFFVSGIISHHNDAPPTPYQVTVSVYLNDKKIESEIPDDGGSGEISDSNVGFNYVFKIVKE